MALGKRRGGGEFLPLLKYDARNGSLHLEDRVQRSRGWEKEHTDVSASFRGVFDLARAEVGWIFFPRGAAPEMQLVRVGEDIGLPPTEEHRQGFRLLVLVEDDPAATPREFMSTSGAAWNAISQLHDDYLAQVGKRPGELPIVTLAGVTEHRFGAGVAFDPEFQIVGWTKRPAEFGPEHAPQSKPRPKSSEMGDEIPF